MVDKTLNGILLAATAAVVFFATACKHNSPVVVYGDAGTGNVTRPAVGRLIVYTDTYMYLNDDEERYPHLPYDIYGMEGTRIKHVPNHLGECDESPSSVVLPPGPYRIVAVTSGRERAEFTVTLKSGRTTEVDVAKLRRETTR